MATGEDTPAGSAPVTDWDKLKKDLDAEKAAVEAKKQLLEAKKALAAAESPSDPEKKAVEDKLAAVNAAKSLADAQKAAADSQKALEAATAAPDPGKKALDDKLAAAKAAKDLADAQKAAADAGKAQSESSLAAFKAKFGEVPASGFTGDVTLKDKAGVTEAALLAAKAVNTAAKVIVDALPAQTANQTILLYAAAEIPNFQALMAFRAQTSLVSKAFADARTASTDADAAAPEPGRFEMEAVPIAAAAGLGLDAVNKLLGFFRTDFTVGGIDVALEDSILVHSLAGLIVGAGKNLSVQLPSIYNPGALADTGAGIISKLTGLSLLKETTLDRVKHHDTISARFTADADKETDATRKAALLENAKTHKDATGGLKAAAAFYDGFLGKLTAADDKGVVPLTNVIREGVIADALANGNLLMLVKIQKSGGAFYTKKNILTALGSMPFFHMGGVVASFVLLEGRTGNVLKSGVAPVHGGFIQADELPMEFAAK
jgi:hypothetical protein